MKKPVAVIFGALLIASLTAVPALAQIGMEFEPGNDAFERTWARTDLPVQQGQADRTWMWGPSAFTEVLQEEYADSPGGMRDVQYFDKARMEINDPNAPDDGLWYVTNGLLVVEMVEGQMQVGDDDFVDREPADVQIVGDPSQFTAPTYADIANLGLRGAPADTEGQLITRALTADNEVVEDDQYAEYGVTAAHRVTVPNIDHTVAEPFWNFMNSSGTVYENGEYITDDLFQNPFYATGFPITEAYWSTVMVAGSERDVLWQCFERRCLSYTPGNPDGFVVEAGNVGQHYYTWRYDQEPEPEPEPEPDTTEYSVVFGSLNGSGVEATGSLTATNGQLTVMIEASGLTPEETHAQHIHGFAAEGMSLNQDQVSICPTPDLDENEDGLISLEEGLPAYGGVVLPLFDDPEAETYPVADADGNVSYEQTFEIDPSLDLTAHTIVLHGMVVDEEYQGSVPVACGQIYEEETAPAAEEYTYNLNELNDSGASGVAELSLVGQVLTVEIEATGLEAEMLHPQHVHGVAEGAAVCPVPEEADANEDGYIDLVEGVPFYGGVLVNMAPYPTADADGMVSFSASYIVDPATIALDDRVIVLHGMTADIEGDDVEGDTYLATLPVACGGPDTEVPEPEPEAEEFMVVLGELNGSGVSGEASLSLSDGELSVSLNASGLTAAEMHMQHIHGVDVDMAVCPGPELDVDENGIVDITEGGPAYGGVALPLFSDIEAEEYPTADADGNVAFSNTFAFEATGEALTNHVIVVHGMDIEGEYDAAVPVACGLIVPADAMTYAAANLSADNEVSEDPVESDGSGEAWFWHDAEAGKIYYMLSANGVEDAFAAHIHVGGADVNGGVVVGLFGLEEGSVAANGILSTGRITDADLTGDLEGMTLGDLVALFGADVETSGAYVNVHSDTYPAGELRDQVVAVNGI